MLKDSHSGNMIPESTSVLEVYSLGVCDSAEDRWSKKATI